MLPRLKQQLLPPLPLRRLIQMPRQTPQLTRMQPPRLLLRHPHKMPKEYGITPAPKVAKAEQELKRPVPSAAHNWFTTRHTTNSKAFLAALF